MLRIIATFAVLVTSSFSAPTPYAQPLIGQQYVLLHPHQQPQPIQYEPLIKLEHRPVFQQITPFGRLDTPQKQQLVFLYPNGPLTQFPLISLRQSEGGAGGSGGGGGGAGGDTDYWALFQNFINNFYPGTQPEKPSEGSGVAPTEGKLPELMQPAIEKQILPASTIPLQTADRHFYIISQQPQQYFGKSVDSAVNSATAPLVHLQQLQPAAVDDLSARSSAAENIISAAIDPIEQQSDVAPLAQPLQQELVHLPSLVPLQAGTPLQLRSHFDEPLQHLEMPTVSDSSAPAALLMANNPSEAILNNDELSDNNNNQLLFTAAKDESRSLVNPSEPEQPENDNDDNNNRAPMVMMMMNEGRSSLPDTPDAPEQTPQEELLIMSSNIGELRSASASITDNKTDDDGNADEIQQSVAQAKPSGLALAGKGGLASSKPSATAVVGDGGIALASPHATAISGEFEDEEEKKNN